MACTLNCTWRVQLQSKLRSDCEQMFGFIVCGLCKKKSQFPSRTIDHNLTLVINTKAVVQIACLQNEQQFKVLRAHKQTIIRKTVKAPWLGKPQRLNKPPSAHVETMRGRFVFLLFACRAKSGEKKCKKKFQTMESICAACFATYLEAAAHYHDLF